MSSPPCPCLCSISALPAPLARFIIIAFCILLISPCCYMYCKYVEGDPVSLFLLLPLLRLVLPLLLVLLPLLRLVLLLQLLWCVLGGPGTALAWHSVFVNVDVCFVLPWLVVPDQVEAATTHVNLPTPDGSTRLGCSSSICCSSNSSSFLYKCTECVMVSPRKVAC